MSISGKTSFKKPICKLETTTKERRRFLASVASGFAASVLIQRPTSDMRANGETLREPPATGVKFALPIRYYARRAKEVLWNDALPEKAQIGWQETTVTLASSNTAVLCMHTENYGFDGGPPWAPD